MSTVTKHVEGTFCWPELATTDEAGAKAFYSGLFGWDIKSTPIGDDMNYNEAHVGDKVVAAYHKLTKDMQGQPPRWMNYIAVDDVDATLEKAKGAGGNVLMGPFDVFDFGRMGVIQDPTGAVVALWQGKSRPGAALLGATGASCWTELMTTDTDKAGAFYTSILPWKGDGQPMKDPAGNDFVYTVFNKSDGMAGGMMKITPQMGEVPPHWMIYFAVDDCDASAKKAADLGGKVVVPPMDIPNVGRFSLLVDPQGAAFSIIKLNAA